MSGKTAAALGFFDGMHIGHAAVIERALKAAGEYGLTPAAFVISEQPELPKFGGRHDVGLIPYNAKVAILGHRFGITALWSPDFDSIRDLSPEEFFDSGILGILNAGFVCCGEDFHFGKGGVGNAELLKKLCNDAGIHCGIVPPVCTNGVPVSSTGIRELIRGGDVEAANKLLIRPFGYELTVLHGRQLGRTIGFPTINQEIPPFMVKPKRGVYASRTFVGDDIYPSITNIGVKPTVKSDDSENMETHIIGCDGDLYDRTVRVELIKYIRGERKFDDLDELKKQLEADRDVCQNGTF